MITMTMMINSIELKTRRSEHSYIPSRGSYLYICTHIPNTLELYIIVVHSLHNAEVLVMANGVTMIHCTLPHTHTHTQTQAL